MKRFFPPAKRLRIDEPDNQEVISSEEDEAPSTSSGKKSEEKKGDIWKSINDEQVIQRIFAQIDRAKFNYEGFEGKFDSEDRYLSIVRCTGFCRANNKPFRCVEPKSNQNPNLKKDLRKNILIELVRNFFLVVNHIKNNHPALVEQKQLTFGKGRIVKLKKLDKDELTELEATVISECHLPLSFFSK